MNDLNSLFSDDIIDKKKLLLKKYKYVGLSKQQAIFISKLFDLKDYKNISLTEISTTLKVKKETVEELVKYLIQNNFIVIKKNNSNNSFLISLENLLKKLFNTYLYPDSQVSEKDKINWLQNILNIKFNDQNINEIKNWINDNQWDNVLLVVNRLLKTNKDKITWPLLSASFYSLNKKNFKQNNQISKILDINWLEN